MSYVAQNPGSFVGQTVGNGQCVAFVQAASGAPQTSQWQQGIQVKGANIPAGTAIATFQNGQYTNDTTGNSHAAIYISQDAQAFLVWDQWAGVHPQTVHQRPIRFQGGAVAPRNDGDAFYVIE